MAREALQPKKSASTKGYRFHPSILRAYDIRGVVGETLSTDDAYVLGALLAGRIRKNSPKPSASLRAVIGYDGRLSSPDLARALGEGFLDSGVQVDVLGTCPTPMLYFAVFSHSYDAGVMVTGSHNPPTHNGFKMMIGRDTLHSHDIADFQDEAALYQKPTIRCVSTPLQVDVKALYLHRILKDIQLKPLKVIWDCGNGATGSVIHELVQKLPGHHSVLFGDVDGRFPNHHPDPAEEKNLKDLIHSVKKNKADVGIAFDGDGDRIGIVDEAGEIIWPDQILGLYARDVLKDYSGSPLIADVKCSKKLFDFIKENGGKAIMSRTGHSYVKAEMRAQMSPLGGEMSGHIFFADKYYGYDDALYAALRLLVILSQSEKPLSELIKPLRGMVATPEIRIEVSEDQKFQIIKDLGDKIKQGHVITIDGLRVETEGGWWLLRASNTQNALSFRAEAIDKNHLKKMGGWCQELLAPYHLTLPLAD